eukprot:TRINITY_DN17129_c0_g1_i1.p1 TRINITY_DN17129_c0_g1~~TRINITY_DN17129_c0_g1_i1.p1  ORF type:complete len:424 (-),score=115.93 TRINITY_DN17129_c0_g1_i1:74-1345(-)
MGRKNQNKRRWRTKVDTKSQDEFLEEQRREERMGSARDATDSQLFVIEKKGKKKGTRSAITDTKDRKLTRAEIRARNRSKTLGVDKALISRSKVAPVRTVLAKQPTKRVSSSGKRALLSYEERKQVARLSNSLGEREHGHEVQRKKRFRDNDSRPKDIWAADAAEIDSDEEDHQDWISPRLGTKKLVPRPKRQPPTNLPAVLVAQEGQSYNPDPEAHQNVLGEAVAYRLKKEEEAWKWGTMGNTRKKSNTMTVMLGEDFEQDPEDEDREPKDSKAVTINRKTKRDRNRQKNRLDQTMVERKKQAEKRRSKDIGRAAAINRELDEEEIERSQRGKKDTGDLSQTRRLSRHKFVESAPAVVLSADLPDALRKRKVVGNAMKDQFEHFQRRNLVEKREPVMMLRRYALRTYNKRGSYKDDDPTYDD